MHYHFMPDAKCPECGNKAKLDDEITEVKCSFCGYKASYDDYIEIMREKAVSMSDDYQFELDKRPF